MTVDPGCQHSHTTHHPQPFLRLFAYRLAHMVPCTELSCLQSGHGCIQPRQTQQIKCRWNLARGHPSPRLLCIALTVAVRGGLCLWIWPRPCPARCCFPPFFSSTQSLDARLLCLVDTGRVFFFFLLCGFCLPMPRKRSSAMASPYPRLLAAGCGLWAALLP